MYQHLPRSTTRVGYVSFRQHNRDCELSREERGLPPHPANAFVSCPDCFGTGEHTRNDSANGDPQTEYPVTCGACGGSGEVQDGNIDPLLLMAKYRAGRFTWAMSDRRKADRLHYYRLYRARAMKLHNGLDVVEIRAIAAARQNEIERARVSLRDAA